MSGEQLLLLLTLCAGELVLWVTISLVLVQLKWFACRLAVRAYFSSNSKGFMGILCVLDRASS